MITRDITPSAARNEVLFVRTIQWLFGALEKPMINAARRWFDEQEYEVLNDSQAFIQQQIELLLASPKVFMDQHVKDVNGKPRVFLVPDTDQADIPIKLSVDKMILGNATFGFKCTATFTPEKRNRRYQVDITREYEFKVELNRTPSVIDSNLRREDCRPVMAAGYISNYSYRRVDNGKY